MLDTSLNAKLHSKLLAAYTVDENAVIEQLEIIRGLSQNDEIEPRYLLAKAYVFGNLVNIKWLYYLNRLTDFVEQNIREQNAPLYCQDYIKGIAYYADIISSFKQPLTANDQLEQYIAYELYRILNLSDDFRKILNIPLTLELPQEVQEKFQNLNEVLIAMLGQAGHVEIMVDYNAFFLKNNPNPDAIQLMALVKNYETVVADFGIAPHIQDKARAILFDAYLHGKFGVITNQEKALSYLEYMIDTDLLEKVAFDLYEGNNPDIDQNKAFAQKLMARCYSQSERVKAWTKKHEPTWYAEFERREQALTSFFGKVNDQVSNDEA